MKKTCRFNLLQDPAKGILGVVSQKTDLYEKHLCPLIQSLLAGNPKKVGV